MMHSLDFLMHRLLKIYFAKIYGAKKYITSSLDGLKCLDCEQICATSASFDIFMFKKLSAVI